MPAVRLFDRHRLATDDAVDRAAFIAAARTRGTGAAAEIRRRAQETDGRRKADPLEMPRRCISDFQPPIQAISTTSRTNPASSAKSGYRRRCSNWCGGKCDARRAESVNRCDVRKCGPLTSRAMTIPALDADRNRFLAAVTLAAAEKFGADAPCVGADGELRKWRMARVGDLLTHRSAGRRVPAAGDQCIFRRDRGHQSGLGHRRGREAVRIRAG